MDHWYVLNFSDYPFKRNILEKFIFTIKIKISQTAPPQRRICGAAPEKHRISSFRAFFQVSAIMGHTVKAIIFCRGHAEEKMREKGRCYWLGALRGYKFSSGPCKGWPWLYIKGAEHIGVTAFKGTFRNFVKVLAVLSCRKECTDDVGFTHSYRENSPLSSVAEPEPQRAASFGRSWSRSRNAMRLRLRLRLRQWY
jgi:hypothetical protein